MISLKALYICVAEDRKKKGRCCVANGLQLILIVVTGFAPIYISINILYDMICETYDPPNNVNYNCQK